MRFGQADLSFPQFRLCGTDQGTKFSIPFDLRMHFSLRSILFTGYTKNGIRSLFRFHDRPKFRPNARKAAEEVPSGHRWDRTMSHARNISAAPCAFKTPRCQSVRDEDETADSLESGLGRTTLTVQNLRNTYMKALLLDKGADYHHLRIGTTDIPEPAAGEILVRVQAVGLNPIDYKLTKSGFPTWRFPHILGLDVAGVVEKLGVDVDRFTIGDHVMYHGDLSKPGGLAEFAVTTAHMACKLPSTVDFVTGASLPCAGLTAYQSLIRRAHLAPGQIVLIHAAAGGVGGFAVQIAKHVGGFVIGTCSEQNQDYVRGLGADAVIDYRRGNLQEAVEDLTAGHGVDLVLESVSREQVEDDLELLAFGGTIVSLLGIPRLERLIPFTVSPSIHEVSLGGAHLFGNRRAQEDLARMGEELLELLRDGTLKPLPIQTFSLEQVPLALAALEEGHVRGKLVALID
jgi:NADPH:quinone reductase-like Zn-dependent oxidoreductase